MTAGIPVLDTHDEPKAGSEIDWAQADKWHDNIAGCGHDLREVNGSRAYLALRAELAAIKAQAEDATEYVLAIENRELRAELAQAKEEIERLRAQAGESVGVLRGRDGNVSMQVIYDHALRYWTEAQRDHLRRRLSSTAQLEAEARVKEDETLIAALMTGCRNDRGRCTICNHDGLVVHGHYSGCAVLLAFSVLAARRSEPAKAAEESK